MVVASESEAETDTSDGVVFDFTTDQVVDSVSEERRALEETEVNPGTETEETFGFTVGVKTTTGEHVRSDAVHRETVDGIKGVVLHFAVRGEEGRGEIETEILVEEVTEAGSAADFVGQMIAIREDAGTEDAEFITRTVTAGSHRSRGRINHVFAATGLSHTGETGQDDEREERLFHYLVFELVVIRELLRNF